MLFFWVEIGTFKFKFLMFSFVLFRKVGSHPLNPCSVKKKENTKPLSIFPIQLFTDNFL